ncbi:hypothetical protein [Oceaniglobus ichthyenteri]|uniref:hypothetical protein n=1 Tax=Oceaniglobus ichthyenteri TaxID=2136177 RepID=UPI000F825914|nr:hypothetical protein [Oceaniglobus ichthyenteri]
MATQKKRTPEQEEDALNAAQGVFTANPLFIAPQVKHMMQAQEKVLDEFEKFSSAWFQRREEATRSMIEAGRRICADNDPAQAMKEITQWQAKSMERLAEDAKCCAEMWTQCTGTVVSNEIGAAEDTMEYTKQSTKPSKATPV